MVLVPLTVLRRALSVFDRWWDKGLSQWGRVILGAAVVLVAVYVLNNLL